ncbi:MAG: D-glycero-beta-D-manno-heptose 1-phosphate adenylyltransferase [Chlorobi bacterium]|nr:MAG: Bifunctional sugar kinase/adenylyltransferase [Chlorobi bacterium OLB7]MBK8910460.1 D-glycero-beta-D-manno-heptose 1-phosphate adenylyltransferase [Chlorobiota bacterium]MBX7216968.1 D-glycero-beta-D-manno-heptose 1-phosphate adenylyltransferase [Candidatus Kapabacteria bacterium]
MPVLHRAELAETCQRLHADGKRIVFTNGCFDILHRGHVSYLAEARALGDLLVVGVNTDASVRRLKGEQRPIVDQDDRAEIVAALRVVGYVSLFDEDTPYELIQAVQPDVLVKGGDYDPEATSGPRYIVGSDIVRQRGGNVAVINLVPGRSTTEIIRKVGGW